MSFIREKLDPGLFVAEVFIDLRKARILLCRLRSIAVETVQGGSWGDELILYSKVILKIGYKLFKESESEHCQIKTGVVQLCMWTTLLYNIVHLLLMNSST
jgi:hypothetical protein